MIYSVIYTYDTTREDKDEIRVPHRAFLLEQYEKGTVLASGPRGTAGSSGMLVVKAENEQEARALLAQDPFVKEGIVTDIDLEEWTVIYGPWS